MSSLKAKVEAIIYATEEPVTLNELASLLKDNVLAEIRAEEEARLALNETLSEGGSVPPDEEDGFFAAENSDGVESSTESTHSKTANESGAPVSVGDSAPAEGLSSEDDSSSPDTAPKQRTESGDKEQSKAVKARLSSILEELVNDYASNSRGMEIRQIAGGYRMATKPEHHDVVVSFAKSLKPPVRLSLPALETLSVIAYKQPITVPEISEIRGVDAAGVIATLLDRKLITTAGRKQVIGRPILYKTTKEFLLRFGLKDVNDLPSMEEFEKLGEPQAELFTPAEAVPNPTGDMTAESASEDEPVTEAVPDAGHELRGESVIPEDGTYATEAEPEKMPEQS
jgi:segregation and condensation protein B